MTTNKLLLLLAFHFLSIISIEAQDLSCQIDSLFKEKIKAAGIVGLSVAIISDKKILWSKGYGYSDLDRKIPYTTETIMNIGSISKSITGICIMRAVQEGRLDLDADINQYLPFKVANPYFPKDRITVRQLATHTSGILDKEPLYSNMCYHQGGDATLALGEFLKNYLDFKGSYYTNNNFLKAEPGREFSYSNIGAALAGYIIERVTGMRLNEYSKVFMFEPLRLKNTGWFFSDIDSDKHCQLYERKGEVLNVVPWYGLVTYPDGGVKTSVSDLTRILLSIIGSEKQILSVKSRKELWQSNFKQNARPLNYGDPADENEGIFWSMTHQMRRIGHVGRDPGINTYMFYDRKINRGLVIFYNTSISRTDRLEFETLYDYLWNAATLLE